VNARITPPSTEAFRVTGRSRPANPEKCYGRKNPRSNRNLLSLQPPHRVRPGSVHFSWCARQRNTGIGKEESSLAPGFPPHQRMNVTSQIPRTSFRVVELMCSGMPVLPMVVQQRAAWMASISSCARSQLLRSSKRRCALICRWDEYSGHPGFNRQRQRLKGQQ